MALNSKLSTESVNAAVDAVTPLFNSGKLRIYDGTQPATADTDITTQVLLAELTFGNPAFGAAAVGVATANAITEDASANATGNAAWFRCVKSDGTSKLCDGSIGTASADIIMATVAIQQNAKVQCSSFTFTLPKSA